MRDTYLLSGQMLGFVGCIASPFEVDALKKKATGFIPSPSCVEPFFTSLSQEQGLLVRTGLPLGLGQ